MPRLRCDITVIFDAISRSSFQHGLGVPFLSIDYTGDKGKVASLIRRIEYKRWSEDWRAIDDGRASARLADLFIERHVWSEYLQAKATGMAAELETTYEKVFPA
jgi:hypothetical protein